jgi:non-heme chloroperoxidase
VDRIVLLGTTTPFLLKTADNPNGIPAATFEGLRAQFRGDFPKWVVDNAPPFFGSQVSPALMQWGINLMFQCSVPVAITCNEALTTTDFRADLANISIPALVIHGDHDTFAPLALAGKPTADLIRGSRLKIYQGAPHGLMFTHIDQLNADILQFIQDTA